MLKNNTIWHEPLVLTPEASLMMMSVESSLRQTTWGCGYPRARHVSFTVPPSGTIMSPEVSSGMKSGGTTTSRYPTLK